MDKYYHYSLVKHEPEWLCTENLKFDTQNTSASYILTEPTNGPFR